MPPRTDAKAQALREHGSFNTHPEQVQDALFCEGEFFDPKDLVQVKYEMLRRVEVDGHSVARAADCFGFSRVAFYQARTAFRQHGLPGLVRKRPGPRRAHKLSGDVLKYLKQCQVEDTSLRARDLAELVRKKFGVTVHPRSIERALLRGRKKGR